MKTLIITVGTRQIGWHCQDGMVRCFGADGGRAHPPHINQLYQELKMERKYHDPDEGQFFWSVRHLGEQYYQFCQERNDFSSVELLLDHKIIADYTQQGLDHIILWGTDQPKTVSWKFRRTDTLWLAELMGGKLKELYPNIDIDVWNPVIAADNRIAIFEQVEGFILQYALDRLSEEQRENFVLMIESKGSVPVLASSLEVCTAALVRQFQVLLLDPQEPDPLFVGETPAGKSTQSASSYRQISISQSFWPLERTRILSAWERGDFAAAKFWLAAHRDRYDVLYKLASHLAKAVTEEVRLALPSIQSWLRSNQLLNFASSENISAWRSHPCLDRNNTYAQILENSFLIQLSIVTENYTKAFFQMAQTLERLLFAQCKQENWIGNHHLRIPDNLRHIRPENYNPRFEELIETWCKLNRISGRSSWYQLLQEIRDKRNKIVHNAEVISENEIIRIWQRSGLETQRPLSEIIISPLIKVFPSSPPNSFILQSLYCWGLNLLESQ